MALQCFYFHRLEFYPSFTLFEESLHLHYSFRLSTVFIFPIHPLLRLDPFTLWTSITWPNTEASALPLSNLSVNDNPVTFYEYLSWHCLGPSLITSYIVISVLSLRCLSPIFNLTPPTLLFVRDCLPTHLSGTPSDLTTAYWDHWLQ